MTIDLFGFVIGVIGALWMKASVGSLRTRSTPDETLRSIGREPEHPGIALFLRGLLLVLTGFALETYSRLF